MLVIYLWMFVDQNAILMFGLEKKIQSQIIPP